MVQLIETSWVWHGGLPRTVAPRLLRYVAGLSTMFSAHFWGHGFVVLFPFPTFPWSQTRIGRGQCFKRTNIATASNDLSWNLNNFCFRLNLPASRLVIGTFVFQLGPRKFWHWKFLKGMGAAQRLKHDTGSQEFCKIPCIRGSPWALRCCQVVFGTFFFKAWLAKILGAEILAKQRRHAASEAQRGGPEILRNRLYSRFLFGTFFVQLGPRKFCEAEIFARHGRHAAFPARRGEPKIVGNLPDSRFVLGTLLLQVCLRNLLLRRAVREAFGERKFLRSMGATQRFRRDAGSQKLWEMCRIRGVSSEPSPSNMAPENFGNGNFGKPWAPRSVRRATRWAKNFPREPVFVRSRGRGARKR